MWPSYKSKIYVAFSQHAQQLLTQRANVVIDINNREKGKAWSEECSKVRDPTLFFTGCHFNYWTRRMNNRSNLDLLTFRIVILWRPRVFLCSCTIVHLLTESIQLLYHLWRVTCVYNLHPKINNNLFRDIFIFPQNKS